MENNCSVRLKCSSFSLLSTTQAPLKVWLFLIKWVIETIWLIFPKRLQCVSRTLKFYYFSLILPVPVQAKLQHLAGEARWDPALRVPGYHQLLISSQPRGSNPAPPGEKGHPLVSSDSPPLFLPPPPILPLFPACQPPPKIPPRWENNQGKTNYLTFFLPCSPGKPFLSSILGASLFLKFLNNIPSFSLFPPIIS